MAALLIDSATVRRPTAELAARRKDLVAELAHQIFIAHAAPGSKTEAFACKLAKSCKREPHEHRGCGSGGMEVH